VDNTIGGTPQQNAWSAGGGTSAWVAFFRDRRLLPQLKLAREPALQRLGDRLCDKLPALFVGIADIKPAILHGDLWSGNIAGVGVAPAVFDPASYYGHAEAEFGMSWCASFSPAFWSAYHAELPRQPGFERRAKLYQLYHYLNHYNLFGGAYYSTAAALLQTLVD
jgi:protein-ribulosamine 3-kinase